MNKFIDAKHTCKEMDWVGYDMVVEKCKCISFSQATIWLTERLNAYDLRPSNFNKYKHRSLECEKLSTP